MPEITRLRPEASRSNPGQDEVWRKLDGGPLPLLETTHSGDLGLGVKLVYLFIPNLLKRIALKVAMSTNGCVEFHENKHWLQRLSFRCHNQI